MFEVKILPKLAVHKIKIDQATGNFSAKIIDYAQIEILKTFLIEREYNSLTKTWKFNLPFDKKILTLSTEKKIFLTFQGENLISVKDELGRVTKYFYEDNFLTKVIYPDGSKFKYFYDEEKNLTKCIGRDGKIVFQNKYDEIGRIIEFDDKIFYRDDQNWQTVEDEKIFYRYNRKRLVTKIIFPDRTEENFEYDADNNLIQKINRSGEKFSWNYEKKLLTQEIFPSGFTKNLEYDANKNLTKIFDSSGREEIFKYSSKNFLVTKLVRLNIKDWRHEIFERDIEGRILTRDVNGQITKYSYDEKSPLPSMMKSPCGYNFSFRYDDAFRLLAFKSDAEEIFFSHDAMNEIFGDTKIFAEIYKPEKNFPKTDIKIFDFGGRLIEARKKVGEKFQLTRFKYDLNDNCILRRSWKDLQTSESATGLVENVKYFYDEQNRLIKKVEKNSETNFKYDCLNREVRKWLTKTKS